MPASRSRPRTPLMRLGIETEFLLAARHGDLATDLNEFVRVLAANHNAKVGSRHRRMRRFLRDPEEEDDYKLWSMAYEQTNATGKSPWGIEMITPVLEVKPGWRDDVIATWRYLEKYYMVSSNDDCATHIHISVTPQYNLDQLKRIASAILYFEPAFEALMPEERRGNEWAQSNWLEGSCLAQHGLSRSKSIEEIERAPDEGALVRMMQISRDPRYVWNFWNVFTPLRTIDFRQPPGSKTANEALSWTELALNFIQVSIHYGSSTVLETYPANIKGLRWYLALVNDPRINEPGRLRRLWAGKDPAAALEPLFAPESPAVTEKMEKKIEKMAVADMKRIRSHPSF